MTRASTQICAVPRSHSYDDAGLFARHGYNGIRIRDIASEADVKELRYTPDVLVSAPFIMQCLEWELQQIHLRGDSLAWLTETENGTAPDRTFQMIGTTLA